MTQSASLLKISDKVIWFKHLRNPVLIEKLKSCSPEQEVTLETDGVIGRWRRMNTGKDGREVFGIRPVGSMQSVWSQWFKTRKGETIEVREVSLADDYLGAASALFCEWSSPEDEAAFSDL